MLTDYLPCHQNMLGGYPPNHILSALQYLASREQKELEDKLASLDVTRDVTALRYGFVIFTMFYLHLRQLKPQSF